MGLKYVRVAAGLVGLFAGGRMGGWVRGHLGAAGRCRGQQRVTRLGGHHSPLTLLHLSLRLQGDSADLPVNHRHRS
jgi:hypothetical protein